MIKLSGKSVVFLSVALFASSCAIHNYSPYPSTILSAGNYDVVRFASAKVTHAYVFGIGGINNKDVVAKLKQDANLKPGEAIANISIHTKRGMFIPLVVTETVSAFADVIRWRDYGDVVVAKDENTVSVIENGKVKSNNFERLLEEKSTLYLVDGTSYDIKRVEGYDGKKILVVLPSNFYKKFPCDKIVSFEFEDDTYISSNDAIEFFKNGVDKYHIWK